MLRINDRLTRTTHLLLALWLTAATGNAETLAGSCHETLPLAAGETWRAPGDGSGLSHCFTIDIPAPGLLMTDLQTAGDGDAGARGVLAPGRSPVLTVKRSAASLLALFTAPGVYRLRVAAEDVEQALPPYRLRTAFLTIPDCGGSLDVKDETDGEMEEDPNPLRSCLRSPGVKDETDGEMEEDPNPLRHAGSLPEIEDNVYDLTSVPRALRERLDELCAAGEVDDHGTAALCATPLGLGEAVAGEIDNPWGDDEDVFRFRLRTLRTVEISTDGPTDTLGELQDRFGHRLGSDDDGGRDGNFRLVRTLVPATYFVRVEGARAASGSYSLTVRTLRWGGDPSATAFMTAHSKDWPTASRRPPDRRTNKHHCQYN